MNAVPAKVAGVKRIVMVTPPQKEAESPPIRSPPRRSRASMRYMRSEEPKPSPPWRTERSPFPASPRSRPGQCLRRGGEASCLRRRRHRYGRGSGARCSCSWILRPTQPLWRPVWMAQAEHRPLGRMLPGDVRPRLCEKGPGAHRGARPREPACRHHQRVARYPGSGGCRLRYGRRDRCGQRYRPRAPGAALRKRHGPSGEGQNAGAIFVGPWSSEPLGDYVAGPNHTLPTGGTALFSNPLSVEDFVKRSSVVCYIAEGLSSDESGGSDACAGRGSVGPCPFGRPASQAYRRGA